MYRLRVLALVLLVYVGLDMLDPSVPGIFFFESDVLFVDGIVDHAMPAPSAIPAAHDLDNIVPLPQAPLVRPGRLIAATARPAWGTPRRPPARPPAPPAGSSTEDH